MGMLMCSGVPMAKAKVGAKAANKRAGGRGLELLWSYALYDFLYPIVPLP